MGKMITCLKRIYTSIFQQNQFKIQTFTYFIPAPKPRNTGYREKQFDTLFYSFINKGFKILDFKAQPCTSRGETSGIWVFFVVKATNAKAEALDLDETFQRDSYGNSSPPSINDEGFIELPQDDQYPDEIEGLYEIKEKP